MKALVYRGLNKIALEDKPKPSIRDPTDAIVKIKYTTICGSDLHILQGHVPTCKEGVTIGHEGVGTIESVGDGVVEFKSGDSVLISCISSCSNCKYCRRGMLAHCEKAGWVLGHTIDGTQAEYVRIPLADSSLYHVPKGVDEKALVMLSDIVPTGHEVGVVAGKVMPGTTVAIVGSGPVGLGALLTAKLYSPSLLIMIDKDPSRLKVAKEMGADVTIDSSKENPEEIVMKLTNGVGCDTVMEAVGIPATFELCQELMSVGGTLANIGVHGKECTLHMEKLWGYNMSRSNSFAPTATG
jgi:alcohol dehydrogenase